MTHRQAYVMSQKIQQCSSILSSRSAAHVYFPKQGYLKRSACGCCKLCHLNCLIIRWQSRQSSISPG